MLPRPRPHWQRQASLPFRSPGVVLLMGPEIRRAPVEGTVVYLPLFKGVLYIPGGCLGFQPSTVV